MRGQKKWPKAPFTSSALLLAALNAPGETIITEKEITRDHTERMLSSFGADISVENISNRRSIKLCGHSELNGQNICVPSPYIAARRIQFRNVSDI